MRKYVFYIFCLSSLIFPVDKIMDIGGSGMEVNEKGSDITMENVVNAKTPGFKEVIDQSYYNPKTNLTEYRVFNSFVIGGFVNTGRNLDFAMENDGFFMVKNDAGTIYLTRDGRFEINEKRQLVSVAGKYRVLNMDRDVIEMPPFQSLHADKQGRLIDQDGQQIAQLGVINVSNYKQLKTLNNVLFYLDDKNQNQLVEVDNVSIRQGFYEGSNVEYTKSLAKMAKTQKYNANVNLIQARLKMLDTMIDIVNKN